MVAVELNPSLTLAVLNPEIRVIWDIFLLGVFSYQSRNRSKLEKGLWVGVIGNVEFQFFVDFIVDHFLADHGSPQIFPRSDMFEAIISIPGHKPTSL